MPTHDKSLSYKASKGVPGQIIATKAALVLRECIAELLPAKYDDTYLMMMNLYDNVLENIWPEEPDDNEEFIQLCCFIELLEDMAEQILSNQNQANQLADLAYKAKRLEMQIADMHASMLNPIEIDGVPMEIGIDLGAGGLVGGPAKTASNAQAQQQQADVINLQNLLKQIQVMTGSQIPPIPPGIPQSIWQQMTKQPRKKKP